MAPGHPVPDSEQQQVEKRAELKAAETNVHQIQAERRSTQAKLAEAKAGYMADATARRTPFESDHLEIPFERETP